MGRSRRSRPGPSGILLIDKPEELTSARVVAIVKRVLGGVKVGHLGTLDPFATGLLPLCLGTATKIAPFLNEADKSYAGVIRLGVVTDTDDITGEVLERTTPPDPQTLDLDALAARFRGAIEQVPPMYSAIKRGGRPMYELARAGEAPELEPRPVRIDRLELTAAGEGAIRIEVDCSKGTYVRSLARDIGAAVGCGATLESLARTSFGVFELAEAVPLADLQAEGGRELAERVLVSPLEALRHLRRVDVDEATAAALRNGRPLVLRSVAAPRESGEVVRVGCGGSLVAVAAEAHGAWKLDRVFAPEQD
jgi:tRNA pseudouridine55 synthase